MLEQHSRLVERVSTQKGTCRYCNYLQQQIVLTRSNIENMGTRGREPTTDLFALLTLHKQQLEGFEMYKQMCGCD